ncbi:MAG: hypothetical protein NDI61_03970 [Bdellovibrionaceae bacterium]|nr:hypothetical protein [Pseudobdellovibrionaceae bacterium]
MNSKTQIKKIMKAVGLSACVLALTGCGSDKASSVTLNLKLGTYSTAEAKLMDLLIPRSHAAVSSAQLCFKRLRFKTTDTNTDASEVESSEDNVDFQIGEVSLSPTSTSLGAITLPAGTYRRVEFDLENNCGSGNSVELVNDNGSYSSQERITIKFSGQFDANDDGVLTLGAQNILDQLNNYSGTGSLKDAAEAVSGELSN